MLLLLLDEYEGYGDMHAFGWASEENRRKNKIALLLSVERHDRGNGVLPTAKSWRANERLAYY